MFQRCIGPACRLHAGDLGLGNLEGDGQGVACLGRCDVPVAAEAHGRSLTIVRRGAIEPSSPAPLPRQPAATVLLRDAAFADQHTLEAARRRGAWRAAAVLGATAARDLVALLPSRAEAPAHAFAGRVLCERDPHLVLEGAAVIGRAEATPHLAVRVPAAWIDARAALGRAAAEARDADLAGELSCDRGVDPVRAARLGRAAQLGVDWYERHLTLVCAVSGDVLRPGVYELPAGASVADALAAAGGAVEGVCIATAARFDCDGETVGDAAAPAPRALVVYRSTRDAIC